MPHKFLTTLIAVALLLGAAENAVAQGVRIDGVSPPAARKGEVVTITGRGFGALNVSVRVGGIQAPVLAANGNRVTFRVPNNAAVGAVQLAAVNPGAQTGSIAFRVLEGLLLAGPPNALVVDTVSDQLSPGVGDGDIKDGVIMSRLDVYLSSHATVAGLNAALREVNGGIVTMLRQQPVVTIAIPPPADADALLAVVSQLNAMTGIVDRAVVARAPAPKSLPPSPADDLAELDHLIPARFPAAWNAERLATEGCATRKVNVLVADLFDETSVANELPGLHFTGVHDSSDHHGYEVTETLAAHFDASSPTGADPFPECLSITGIGVTKTTHFEEMARVASNFPAGGFLLNHSMGYDNELPCLPNCTAAQVNEILNTPLDRAYQAAEWKRLTMDRWPEFLAVVSAGNDRNKAQAFVYRGVAVAALDSFMSVVTLPDLESFQQDATNWSPPAACCRRSSPDSRI